MLYQNLVIEKASTETGPSILDLLKSRASHLKSKGSKQWSFLLTGLEDAEILELVSKGYFYKVLYQSNNQSMGVASPLVATFMLSAQQEEWDIHLWGQEESPDTVYLHKLAVSLDHKGEGLGDQLLDWIKQHIQKRGYTKIRLDCVADSEKLKDFYEKNGFVLLDMVDKHCLYEWQPSVRPANIVGGS
ncbi:MULTISPECIES: GNAT family N-acetyltransferase [unclassified Sutcliffiella]|uniref:GNAT family N-acetyltransferase n=1 Tax=unclassified Sutcliffiella TaxID=2837532 RepID=UPI0030D242EC